MTTQLAFDTELSAVNSILGSIGQSPVTNITGTALNNPEISLVKNLLLEATKDIQNEGWHFNKQYNKKVSPDSNGNFVIPTDYLRFDVHGGQYDRSTDLVRKNGKLFDMIKDTDVFTEDLYFDITYLRDFEDVPPAIQRYIISRASVRAATQIVSNPELVELLQQEEARNRATALEYDCEQGDHSFFGLPQESSYAAYQPYKTLIR